MEHVVEVHHGVAALLILERFPHFKLYLAQRVVACVLFHRPLVNRVRVFVAEADTACAVEADLVEQSV